MAFPGTLNIEYYKGDTHEFRIYPKQADGSSFNLTGYTAKFSFSKFRGAEGSATYHEAFAQISDDKTSILCAIRPYISAQDPGDQAYLTPGDSYVYDVEIKKSASPYPLVYTVLTGDIAVTDQVSITPGLIESTTYTVTYSSDSNTSGTVPVDTTKYLKDQTVVVKAPTNITNPGQTFKEWNTQANGLGTAYSGSGAATFTMGTANVTLYAQWNNA